MVNVNFACFDIFRLAPIVALLLSTAGMASSEGGKSEGGKRDGGRSPVTCVLELFTSQGCSSCPPADRLLASIARKPDVVVVSLPVDYWDYIGWKDTLASPAFTARQMGYAAATGSRQVYTPSAIVNGLYDAIGSDAEAIERALAAARGGHDEALSLHIKLIEAGGHIWIEVPAGAGGPAGVYLLRVIRARTVQIGRGENAGRSVTYTNVVRAIKQLGEWSGSRASFESVAPRGNDEGYVVLVQRGTPDRPGVILAAAKTAGL
jgi:hypothetical protein